MKRLRWLGGALLVLALALVQGAVREAFRSTPKSPATAHAPVATLAQPITPPVDQSTEARRWDHDVAVFLDANCDLRSPPNLAVLQEWIDAVAKVVANPSNAMMLERGAASARHDPRYQPTACQ